MYKPVKDKVVCINYRIPFDVMRGVKLRCTIEGISQSKGVEKALQEWGEKIKLGEVLSSILDDGEIPLEILTANEEAKARKI